MADSMTGAELLVKCLETAEVSVVFGVPGEENLDFLAALRESPIRFITTRHEQGAAFMADVYGRLTGRPGVCSATLGPGATNLLTAVADAFMDHAPLLAIAGQGASRRLHKESHQIIDLEALFAPVTKYSARIAATDTLAETVATALSAAVADAPGPAFIALPEDVAGERIEARSPIESSPPPRQLAPAPSIQAGLSLLSEAERPLVLVGNGVVRAGATDALQRFVDCLAAPFTTTFMAKGAISDRHRLALATTGVADDQYSTCGFAQSDLVIAIGYDLVEYEPAAWHRDSAQRILHVDSLPAAIDDAYRPAHSIVGDLTDSLTCLADGLRASGDAVVGDWARELRGQMQSHAAEDARAGDFPIKPQRLLHDLREVMADEDILISDVGAHKVWIAHLWRSYLPDTCIISNGFAAMGIALPGAIAARLAYPARRVVAATGDAGLLMNCQEIETALRLKLELVVLVWNDGGYGLIEWHQNKRFGKAHDVRFGNPDFVAFAESFGARGFRVNSADELLPVLREALCCGTVAVVDCPIDYRENMRLSERLGSLRCGG